MDNQDLLIYLQQVLKQHNMESSLDELAAICSRYEITKIEDLQPDTISGIYHTLLNNRQKNDSVGGSSIATLLKQRFQKKVETEAQEIVKAYQQTPVEVQETVIKTMLQKYAEKNPKLDEFLQEADYAKIAEENIQNSQKMLKWVLLGLLGILVLLSFSNIAENISSGIRKNTVYVIEEKDTLDYVIKN